MGKKHERKSRRFMKQRNMLLILGDGKLRTIKLKVFCFTECYLR